MLEPRRVRPALRRKPRARRRRAAARDPVRPGAARADTGRDDEDGELRGRSTDRSTRTRRPHGRRHRSRRLLRDQRPGAGRRRAGRREDRRESRLRPGGPEAARVRRLGRHAEAARIADARGQPAAAAAARRPRARDRQRREWGSGGAAGRGGRRAGGGDRALSVPRLERAADRGQRQGPGRDERLAHADRRRPVRRRAPDRWHRPRDPQLAARCAGHRAAGHDRRWASGPQRVRPRDRHQEQHLHGARSAVRSSAAAPCAGPGPTRASTC